MLMTGEQIETFIETIEWDIKAFEKLENKLHPDKKICGLLYYRQLMNKSGHDDAFYIIAGADHDVVYLENLKPAAELDYENQWELTEQDLLYLNACSIYYDSDNGFCMSA